MQNTEHIKVSVLIPTYNGGVQFQNTLHAVLTQQTNFKYEIIIVDSSSTDGTTEFIHKQLVNFSNIHFLSIPKTEFQHGKTRNYGILKCKGEFVALLTQDAMPANNRWLESLIEPLLIDKNVAGVFGKHIPYQEADIFEKNNILKHFEQFGDGIVHYKLLENDKSKFIEDASYRGFICFYSDNNSALRKSIWTEIPYPEVAFGEDQLWAREIISKGHTKAYTSKAIVYHSHCFGLKEYLNRFKEEGAVLYEAHGWKICSTILGLPKQIAYLVKIDWLVLKNENGLFKKIYWFYYSIIRNTLKAVGLYIGYKISAKIEND
jgi:rhamnosyltransferase